jgi:hypothetical protein
MFDPDTLEYHNEFVEIYNLGDETVNLMGWRIGDSIELDAIIGTDKGLLLPSKKYAVILDASYFMNSNIYDTLIPDTAFIFTIDDGSFGKSGWSNSKTESVLLKSTSGDIVQAYNYSIKNSPGYSDEKIFLSRNNSKENWSNSRAFRGTPGKLNSVTPIQWDIKVDSIWTEPAYPLHDSSFVLLINISNVGSNAIKKMDLTIYEDQNENFYLDVNEIIYRQDIDAELHWNASILLESPLEGLSFGRHILGVLVTTDFEQKIDNNNRILYVEVENLENPIIINEIMFRPRIGWSEWIELFNISDKSVNLSSWKFSDAKDTVSISTIQNILPINEYLIICGDSSTAQDYNINLEKIIIIKSFPILNNDSDKLKLISPSGRLVDYINYSDSWMNKQTSPGISLERVNPRVSGQLSENWIASVDPSGSTPASINSVFIEKEYDASVVTIFPNPFSPDGDGFEDLTFLELKLPVPMALLSLEIFDIMGRNIRHLADQVPIASHSLYQWDGKDNQGRIARIGIYVVLIRIQNNAMNFFYETKMTMILVKK